MDIECGIVNLHSHYIPAVTRKASARRAVVSGRWSVISGRWSEAVNDGSATGPDALADYVEGSLVEQHRDVNGAAGSGRESNVRVSRWNPSHIIFGKIRGVFEGCSQDAEDSGWVAPIDSRGPARIGFDNGPAAIRDEPYVEHYSRGQRDGAVGKYACGEIEGGGGLELRCRPVSFWRLGQVPVP